MLVYEVFFMYLCQQCAQFRHVTCRPAERRLSILLSPMQVTCINRKRGGYAVFRGGCAIFYTFLAIIFNKNKEHCIFLIHISCFGDFLLRKVQKNGFWKTIL